MIEKRYLNRTYYLGKVYGLFHAQWDDGKTYYSRGQGSVIIERGISQGQPYAVGRQMFTREEDGVITHHEINYKVPASDQKSGMTKLIEIARNAYFNQEMADAYAAEGFKYNP